MAASLTLFVDFGATFGRKSNELAAQPLQEGEGLAGACLVDFAVVEHRQHPHDVLEMRVDDLADVRADEFAISGNDHREWHTNKFDTRCLGHGHGIFLPYEDRVIELGLFGVRGNLVRKVNRDANYDKAVLALLILEGLSKGISRRQGAHHVAQKFSRRCFPSHSEK